MNLLRTRRGTRTGRRSRLRLHDIALALLAILLTALLAARLDPQGPETVPGVVRVVDGDTLIVRLEDGAAMPLRLSGIDAPERGQTCERPGDGGAETYGCGVEAAARLAALTGPETRCVAGGRDLYGRLIGRCQSGGRDVAALLVEGGNAVSDGAYGVEEAAARLAGRGLWAGEFDRPDDWRRLHGDATTLPAKPLEAAANFVRGSLDMLRRLVGGGGYGEDGAAAPGG